ncbi:MAG TPA: PfkB family carbohydrate kinase [Longimicrobiales bacterium]|nr:PfkB family carbohydrate kinase [Longimicrobiales bacterium]
MDRLDTARARGLLEAFRTTRVLVVGDVMLDEYLGGGATRISPEAPVPVVRVSREWKALGGAANVAANLVALGARASLVGIVGEDAGSGDVRRVAAELGIDGGGLVPDASRPTTLKTRVLVGHQQVARYDREVDDDLSTDRISELCGRVEALAAEADAIALEDYDKGVLVPAVIEAALDAGRRFGIPVVVDPKARHFFDYRGCTVFKPNHPELAAALRAPVLAEDPAWLERTRRHLQCENLLVTLGADGMALARESGAHLRVPAVARAVYDVSGAGDTVTAVIAATLGSGGELEAGAMLATHAAGVEVGKAGVVTVSPEEIMESVARLAEHPGRGQEHGTGMEEWNDAQA